MQTVDFFFMTLMFYYKLQGDVNNVFTLDK